MFGSKYDTDVYGHFRAWSVGLYLAFVLSGKDRTHHVRSQNAVFNSSLFCSTFPLVLGSITESMFGPFAVVVMYCELCKYWPCEKKGFKFRKVWDFDTLALYSCNGLLYETRYTPWQVKS